MFSRARPAQSFAPAASVQSDLCSMVEQRRESMCDRGRIPRARTRMLSFDKDVLTTGEVAKICNVAPRTVSKWFDTGVLKGYRIPGSKDRRIPVSQLVRFMKEHGIPFDGMSGGKTRVLIVDDEQEIVD